jgi:hypothetical protein
MNPQKDQRAPRPHHGIFADCPDRRPHKCTHPYRRHPTISLPRRHICPSGKILGVSPERHAQNEVIRFDSGWVVAVSLVREDLA